jgi:hypothetical protein
VIEKQPGALALRHRLPVDRDHIVGRDIERGRRDDAAIDRDAALRDPFLGIPARANASSCDDLGDPVSALLFLRRSTRGALVEIGFALAISAATTECRAFGENSAVIFVVATRTILTDPALTRFTARMFLPVAPSTRSTVPVLALETRTSEAFALVSFRPIVARP